MVEPAEIHLFEGRGSDDGSNNDSDDDRKITITTQKPILEIKLEQY
jgi:hypothetical protein